MERLSKVTDSDLLGSIHGPKFSIADMPSSEEDQEEEEEEQEEELVEDDELEAKTPKKGLVSVQLDSNIPVHQMLEMKTTVQREVPNAMWHRCRRRRKRRRSD